MIAWLRYTFIKKIIISTTTTVLTPWLKSSASDSRLQGCSNHVAVNIFLEGVAGAHIH